MAGDSGAIEASPDGSIMGEIYKPDEAQGRNRREAIQKPIPKWDGLFYYEGPKPIGGSHGNE